MIRLSGHIADFKDGMTVKLCFEPIRGYFGFCEKLRVLCFVFRVQLCDILFGNAVLSGDAAEA